MAFFHGAKFSEVPTSILSPVEVAAGIPFIVGTAPVNMSDVENVNKPQLVYSYAEAVEKFGFVPAKLEEKSGLKKFEFTISEFIKSQLGLFGVAPAIIVNVLDPKKHKKSAQTASVMLDAKTGSVVVAETGVIPSSITLGAYAAGVDFVTAFDEDGQLVVTSLKGSDGAFLCPVGEAIDFSAEVVDPSAVTVDDVIGGADVNGNLFGFELVEECFPRFRLVPGLLLAPGFSQDAGLAAVMATKASAINQVFMAGRALIDVPTDSVKQYSEVPAWKNENNIVDPMQDCLWPMISLAGECYHMSTQLAGLYGRVDADNGDVPYVSPSNKNLQMTSAVLADGTEVNLGLNNANYLNGQGITTALNFSGGWVAWGNHTAAFPANTDIKDSFGCQRRMFAFIGNTFVQTFWQRVDFPLNRRQIDTIVESANDWIAGMVARQQLLGGRVEFLADENPTTDIMSGIARFHVFITPPSPNQEIEFVLEYDPAYLETLFA